MPTLTLKMVKEELDKLTPEQLNQPVVLLNVGHPDNKTFDEWYTIDGLGISSLAENPIPVGIPYFQRWKWL